MPQMMPLNWLMLFIFFISIFMLINIFNYYLNMPLKNFNFQKKNNKKNWKW